MYIWGEYHFKDLLTPSYYFIVELNWAEGAACPWKPDQRAKNTPRNKKLISWPALLAIRGFYSPLPASPGLELATVSNLKASVASRPRRLRFDTRHYGTNLSFMQNTVEIEQVVITRPVRINTHTHTHTHTPPVFNRRFHVRYFHSFISVLHSDSYK